MKVHTKTNIDSRGVQRVAKAMGEFFGDISYEEADVVFIHAVGRLDNLKRIAQKIKESGKEYAIVQYALRSTQKPSTKDWFKLWCDAKVVWSYYDLNTLCAEDNLDSDFFNFYHAPLGTNFEHSNSTKEFIIATSGLSYLTESVRECVLAAREIGKRTFHVGPNLGIPNVIYAEGMTDEELMKYYSHCSYVSGLRRIEGFELPVIEGLMCGARPVVFDRPHYRNWFGDLAEYIPEDDRQGVINSLEKIFSSEVRKVTKNEIKYAKEFFNWQRILRSLSEKL